MIQASLIFNDNWEPWATSFSSSPWTEVMLLILAGLILLMIVQGVVCLLLWSFERKSLQSQTVPLKRSSTREKLERDTLTGSSRLSKKKQFH